MARAGESAAASRHCGGGDHYLRAGDAKPGGHRPGRGGLGLPLLRQRVTRYLLRAGNFVGHGAHRLPKLTSGFRFMLVAGGIGGWVFAAARLTDQPGPPGMQLALARLIISFRRQRFCMAACTARTICSEVVLSCAWVRSVMGFICGIYRPSDRYKPVSPGSRLAAARSYSAGTCHDLISGIASYRWVESPFLRLKDRFTTVLSRPV